MAPTSHLTLHIPLLSRNSRRSQHAGAFGQEDANYSVKNRPISLPLLNAQGNLKQTSITNGTLKHDPHAFMTHHRNSPLSIERPGAPIPQAEGTGRRRSQTLPCGLPLHLSTQNVNETPRSVGRYALFPVEQSPVATPTPTATMPKQLPLTDRQRRALPKPPQQELENVKKNNAELKQMLEASNQKVSMIMSNLTAEEIRADELESRSRRLEASLKALTIQQHGMMAELKALRSQLQEPPVTATGPTPTARAMTPPRKSSKRPKGHAEMLRDDNIQLEIALRAPKLIGLQIVEKENEEWVHPAHRSSSADRGSASSSSSIPRSLLRPVLSTDLTASSDASSDVSFRDITAAEIEKYCANGSPSDGPEFWDPAYYEGVPSNAPLTTTEPHNYIDTLAIMALDTFPVPPTQSQPQDFESSRTLSPIPGTPSPGTVTPPLRLNTNLSAQQRGIRAAGIAPVIQHRPSNVHLHNTTRSNNISSTHSPLARPSGPRPSYAMRKMSMQGHLAQSLQQPSPDSTNGTAPNQPNMASTYRPERRPSSIVRALASQGFGMGANGCPLGMSTGLSSSSSSESMGGPDSSASGGSSADVESAGQVPHRLRRTSSAWSSRSSACSPKTVKTPYRWGAGGQHGELAN